MRWRRRRGESKAFVLLSAVQDKLEAPSGHEHQFTHRKTIVAGENQVHRQSIVTYPLGRQAARLARANVPVGRVKYGRPRSPRLWRFIDAKAAGKTRVPFFVEDDLAQEIALQAGVVADRRAI